MNITEQKPVREIPFFSPSFDRREEEAAIRVLHSGWLTTGKETLAFEKEFADMVHSPYALAVNSASNGLMLAMEAFGIGTGTKILTSPYTFVSTATSALHLGGEAVYADIEADSYSLDPEKIEDKLKQDKSIKAIVPIHIAGNLCNMKAINSLAKKYNVAVIEDAAHAFPAKTADGYGGTFGGNESSSPNALPAPLNRSTFFKFRRTEKAMRGTSTSSASYRKRFPSAGMTLPVRCRNGGSVFQSTLSPTLN